MNHLQYQASNPNHSIWVLASAGTGKTKILTDRVLRLLLSGVEFSKILCLTFTNAGAQEMFLRINAKLVEWSNLNHTQLAVELKLLLLRDTKYNEIKLAQDLYRIFLNLPYKIHIYTIHSFCQKILKIFPLEAGIAPGSQIIDEIKIGSLISKVRNLVFMDEKNQEIIEFFTSNFHELIIDELIEDIIEQKLKFKQYFAGAETDYVTKIDNLEIQKKKIICSLIYDLHKLYDIIIQNHLLDNEENLQTLCNLIKDKKNIIDNEFIYSFFLTKTGDKRSKILAKKLVNTHPHLIESLNQVQEQIYLIDQINKTQKMYEYTNLLLKFAKIFLLTYEKYKKSQSLLDYDDLIYFTNKLLASSEAKDWVLYKLDGGIDHILIDESQDTSPEQWQIIQNLIEEFYSGQGSAKNDRTIFVVGDEKQSIFSFQGANLQVFYMMNKYFEAKLKEAKKECKIINLEYSYRSAPAIIEAIYNIFTQIKQDLPNSFGANNPLILPFRKDAYGQVELWPLVTANKKDEFFWQEEGAIEKVISPHKELAIKIASYIQKQITNKIILSSTKSPAKAGDFLILVRKRDELATEIIIQLKLHDLNVMGIDRLKISDNLSVMDLISIAKFVLTPFDDLNLASLLKSPIIGLSDREIKDLARNKSKTTSLWERLRISAPHPIAINILKNFINLYHITNTGNFFHHILDHLGYREVLIRTNGLESNEAINELLYLSSAYAKDSIASLQDFIYWFEENEIEVKCLAHGADKIRIMTVHGSKGLEAPVVILCDTTSMPVSQNKFIWKTANELIANNQGSNSPKIFQDIKDIDKQKEFEEYLRLFYVALTRASDHLVICGYHKDNKIPETCWYNLAQNSMRNFASIMIDGGLIYKKHQIARPENNLYYHEISSLQDASRAGSAIDHLNKILNQVQNDSTVVQDNMSVILGSTISSRAYSQINSPLVKQDNLKYGQIFHKILEDTIKIKQIHKIHDHPLINSLSTDLQDRFHKAADNLINNKEFINLLTHEIKTEVSIGLNTEGKFTVGRIDLLVFDQDNITIIDYKSDMNPPDDSNLISPEYIKQLKNYQEIIRPLYKCSTILCKILWLETGQFTNITNLYL